MTMGRIVYAGQVKGQSSGLRALLFQSSALGLGVSLAVLKPGAAEAQNPVCQTTPGTAGGPQTIVCPAGNYGVVGFGAGQDTIVTFEPGAVVTGGVGVGAHANVSGIDVTLDISDADVTRISQPTGFNGGAFVNTVSVGADPTTAGTIQLIAGDVDVSAPGGIGLYATGGDTRVVANSVHTRGAAAPQTPFGIFVNNTQTGGDISIDVNEVSTAGVNAHAVLGYSLNGASDVTIRTGMVTTTGQNALGVYAETGTGLVDIDSGSVTTTGVGAIGVLGRSLTGAVNIDSVSAETSGAGAYAVLGSGGGDITVNSGYAATSGDVIVSTGQRAIAIVASSVYRPENRTGNVVINSQLVEYTGAGAIGIYGASYDGDITVNSEAIVANASSFFSDPAAGGNGLTYSPVAMAFDSYTGDITINSGTIINTSQHGAGIAVNRTTGVTTINTELITTAGDGAMGITTGGVHGDVVINSGSITTNGDAVFIEDLAGAYLGRDMFFADGIEAISLSGSATVNSEDVTVNGENNQGITIIAAQNATLNSGNVKNMGEGDNAVGIVIDNGVVNANLTGVTNAFQGWGVSVVALNESDVNLTNAGGIFARDGGIDVTTGSGATVITNTGNIETTRTEAVDAGAAIRVNAAAGGSVTINNSGAIRGGSTADGQMGAAIVFSDGEIDETLNLFTGSQIVGIVDGQGGADTLNLEGTVDALTETQGFGNIVNFETINANSGVWVQSGVAAVDTINVNDGALIITGAAAGDTTIAEAAVLQIGAGGTTGSLDGDIVANGTLIFHREDDYLFGGALSGDGSLIKRGAGLVTLDGVYSFTGTTSIQAGRLKITQLAADGDLDLGADGELDLSGGDQSVGGLTGDAGSTVNIDEGSLTINQEEGETSTFGGSLVGDGALTVDGGGALNLTGVNTYTGPTTVENGTLLVNGSISSAVSVNDGSVLGGAGTINGSILIRRNGVLSPGNSPGVLTVGGPLTLSSGSTLLIEVDPTHPLVNDRLDVTGAVTIEPGALLEVAPQGAINLYQRVNEYTIINAAGGLSGAFAPADISSTMALLTPRLDYRPNQLRLQLIRNDIRFNQLANSPNQFALATAAEATGNGRPVYNALIAQSDQGLRTAYTALSGEGYGSAGTFLVHEAIVNREGLLRRAAKADVSRAWVELVGHEATFDDNIGRGSAEVDAASTGYSLGGQLVFDHMAIGGTLTTSKTDLDVLQRATDLTVDSLRVGAFATAQTGFIVARMGLEYGQSDVSGSRNIVFPGVSEAAMSDFSGTQLQVFGEVAFETDLGLFDMEPFVGLSTLEADMDGFQENGPLGLNVQESSRYITFATAGLRFAGPDDWFVKPHAAVSLRHAAGDLEGVVTSAFAGGPRFDVIGANVDSDTAVIDAGLDYAIAPNMDLSISYAGVFGSGTRQHVLGAQFGMRF